MDLLNNDWLKSIFGIDYTDVNQFLVRMGTILIICILVLVVGFWLAKMLSKGRRKVLRRSYSDE
ncbi:MAG: mechanosensitive ion channel family protein, partial [Bacteroidota bacterium]